MSITDSIAILLATYNGESFITEQLESLRDQTYKNFTVYIHDDGSNDKTIEKIEAFCKSDNRFRLIEAPVCGGARDNFFFLMKCIENEQYIMFCDQDDYWHEEKVDTTLYALKRAEQTAQYVCAFSDLEVVDSELITIDESFYSYSGKNPELIDLSSLIMNNVVVGCTMMVNRALLDKGLEYTNYELLFMHDWWLALIASACGKIVFIDKPLIKYRQHQGNVVGANPKRKLVTRLVEFLTLKNLKSNKKKVQRSVAFSKALDQIIDDDSMYKHLIHEMSAVDEHRWLYRVVFFYRNKLISIKQIWRFLWI